VGARCWGTARCCCCCCCCCCGGGGGGGGGGDGGDGDDFPPFVDGLGVVVEGDGCCAAAAAFGLVARVVNVSSLREAQRWDCCCSCLEARGVCGRARLGWLRHHRRAAAEPRRAPWACMLGGGRVDREQTTAPVAADIEEWPRLHRKKEEERIF